MEAGPLVDALVGLGPAGLIAALAFWLWKQERDDLRAERAAREIERKEARDQLAALNDKRNEESREFMRDQAATRATLEALSVLIKDRDRREAA